MAHRLDRGLAPDLDRGRPDTTAAMLRRDGRVALKRKRGLK